MNLTPSELERLTIFTADIAKCWQLASVMKDRVGRLPEEKTARADNERIKRYIAKYTINPARADGKLLKVEPATRVPLCRKYLLR